MKFNISDLVKKFTTVKKIVDQSAADVSRQDLTFKPVEPADPEDTKIVEALLNIQKAYIDGNKDLLIRNSTAVSAAVIETWPFPPNPSIFIQKNEKVDSAAGPIVIATTVLKEPGKYYKRNLVLVQENGKWKYDIAQSEAHPIAQT